MIYPDGQRYYGLSVYLKKRFLGKVKKIMLVSGCTCPNRDGRLGTGGCIFCSSGGSGEFAGCIDGGMETTFYSQTRETIKAQIIQQLQRIDRSKEPYVSVIAYFQSFTNTYGSVSYLEPLFMEAILHERVCALSIATRPDCISDEMLELLERLSKIKPVMVELGLQSMHEETALWMHRGYSLEVFEDACKKLRKIGIEVIVHTILGLKDESPEDHLKTIRYLNTLDIQGVKLQLLFVLKDTILATLYEEGAYVPLSEEEYVSRVCACIACLRPDIVIHRLTGDGKYEDLIAPLWSKNKKQVLNHMRQYMKKYKLSQGINA